ncbi:MAG: MerR family transcriptional regulator [Candidatus Wallbacteria bacterium]|nr:MerR family transcriptional regulator [Candidatus Wallbacteria bacterium]
MSIRWRLEQLTRVATRVLEHEGLAGDSRRVRWMPDARTARYYTTVGLLDRPAGFEGRTALYGLRHLLQLVAIKRLQASGASLEEVQRRLAGLPQTELECLAQVPAGLLADASAEGTGDAAPKRRPETATLLGAGAVAPRREANLAPDDATSISPPAPARRFWSQPQSAPRPTALAPDARPLTAVAVSERLTLLLELPAGRLDPASLARLRAAAAPLIELVGTMADDFDSKDD